MTEPFDVVIVGGGMVGASLAIALAPSGLRIAVVEAVVHDAEDQPSFDDRTTALSNGSRRVLETLSLWPTIGQHATPIKKIHVSEQGRFGFARIDAGEQGLDALGFVLPNRVLGRSLWARIAECPTISVMCPRQVIDVSTRPGSLRIELNAAASAVSSLETRLLVAADGAHSAVRSALGVEAKISDYGQSAVITTILPQKFHDYVAYERFTREGPLAVLPMTDGRCTLVLTLPAERAQAAMLWTEEEFLREVQGRFGFRLGRILKAGRRSAYPLSLTQSSQTSVGRCAIIGNAAQGLHPVAGMGFNLGLRDVACLAESLIASRDAGNSDCGDPNLLAEYDRWRAGDRGAVIAFTDGLVRLFANPSGVLRRLRNLGLLAFDLAPPAKAALSRLSTGAATGTRVPKLARGVPLQ